jgi:hypothetical protein
MGDNDLAARGGNILIYQKKMGSRTFFQGDSKIKPAV